MHRSSGLVVVDGLATNAVLLSQGCYRFASGQAVAKLIPSGPERPVYFPAASAIAMPSRWRSADALRTEVGHNA